MTLEELNRAPAPVARAALERCCGARAWIEGMFGARPFVDHAALLDRADRVAGSLTEADWREAFAHHPRIGDVGSLKRRFATTAAWAGAEQAAASAASDGVLMELAQGNRDYEARFGYIFIVCATGRSASELLDALRARITNDPAREIRNAIEEQMKITRLRLEKLLAEAE
jgi:2-oxo-4-hydroxy-4-carboxy-5-ureidoimidazoline decarboxylase